MEATIATQGLPHVFMYTLWCLVNRISISVNIVRHFHNKIPGLESCCNHFLWPLTFLHNGLTACVPGFVWKDNEKWTTLGCYHSAAMSSLSSAVSLMSIWTLNNITDHPFLHQLLELRNVCTGENRRKNWAIQKCISQYLKSILLNAVT